MRQHYRVLHTSSDFFLLRRVAWVCESREARSVVSYWMKDRHSRDGQGSELLLVRNIREVGDLFSGDEINSLKAANEFAGILRLDAGERVFACAVAC
ncbi:hypothetical protein [Candidatus Viadribacter manganicus]|uniref:Uncharacterized protein n=1 Tax=Candidatus Viadribacter manganicus TaxID=1759059 RepID=A0A1B1AMF3_9PROT|nr:hypothetical protein [Candidatus Viadribacter manganicus]ANP47721.1 hypothetical protein ATE48_18355 [Candidatus Viadribacter manganicus]